MTDQQLPCGYDPLQVWDHAAADYLDSHEQTCPYCQGVVDEYNVLAGPIRAWKAAPVEVPPSLLDRVMTTVRTSLQARNYLPLVSPLGPIRLDTATAAAVLRWAVDQHGAARARSCKIEPIDRNRSDGTAVADSAGGTPGGQGPPNGGPPGGGPGDADVPEAPVAIRLTVTAARGTRLPHLADELRRLVRAVGTDLLGLDVTAIDVTVVDLFSPSG